MTCVNALLNWSLDTETQLQEAASPQELRSGCLQRWDTTSQS